MKNNRRTYIIALLVVAAGLVIYFMLKPGEEVVTYTQDEALEIPFNKQGELFFIDNFSGDTISVIDIEVADNDQKRARGLMYRESIPDNGGMLFVHDYETIQSFWMKNTFIALDMIFVNSNKEIVTIHHNTSPMKDWSYTSTGQALYVVEVNAGYCYQNNIKNGDRIDYNITQ